jgi:hypothetical protein
MAIVTVALVGDPANPGHSIPEAEWGRRWEDRPRIELEVQPTDSLGSIRERALEQFGVATPNYAHGGRLATEFPFVAFYSESRPTQMSGAGMSITVTDDLGRAVWSVDPDLARFDQLVSASELGALEGDPQRIYLILLPPSGNGIFVDWQSLLDAWRITWDVLESIDTVAGAAAAAEFVRRKIRNRLQRGRPTVEHRASEWGQRNGNPHDVAGLLGRRSWTAEEASGLLGVTTEDAIAVLAIFGFAQDGEDQRWYRDGDQAAALLGAVLDEVWRYPPREDAPMFRTRINEILRTGDTMPYPDYREQQQQHQIGGEDAADPFGGWNPEHDSRMLASTLLAVVLVGSLIAAIAFADGLLQGLGIAAVALFVSLVLIRTRVFSDLSRWLTR